MPSLIPNSPAEPWVRSMDYEERTLAFAVALVLRFPWRSDEPIDGADVVDAVNELLDRFGVPVRRSELRCPNGHAGPFRYLETHETHRDVLEHRDRDERTLVIDGYYKVYDEDEAGLCWLECHHGGDEWCGEKFKLPPTLDLDFV